MKKKLQHIFMVLICMMCMASWLTVTSCIDEEYPDSDTPQGNFEALWRLMDEHYCFFEYKKQQIGVDWDEVHERYAAIINDKMTVKQLFEVLCNMLAELKDGHVNLGAGYDLGRNWSYWEDYPENFNDSIQRSYLGTDYQIASALDYTILTDNIGYIRCADFSEGLGDGNISDALTELQTCTGLIIDVRNNGGGKIDNARRLASHFTNTKRLTGYVYHKTGTGHNDFSDMEEEYLEPADGVRWQKRTVVLTNRKSFSATNDFVNCMSTIPSVTLMGDTTGGGSGMPFTQELPSGWSVRYSAVVYLNAEREHIEFGIAPDTVVIMNGADLLRRRDTLIEAAREYLKN